MLYKVWVQVNENQSWKLRKILKSKQEAENYIILYHEMYKNLFYDIKIVEQ